MNQPNGHIPFYHQMISLLRNAMNLLDEQGQDEFFRFLVSQQNADGGFKDRGGRSDLYYSLFGMLLMRAWSMGHGAESRESGDRRPETEAMLPEREAVEGSSPETRSPKAKGRSDVTRNPKHATESNLKLKNFIAQQSNGDVHGFIERCCLVLLQKELKARRNSRIATLVSLGKSFWKERHSINLSYRSFVLFLTLDAVLPFRNILKIGAKRMLKRTLIDEHSPCSEVAAKVFLQKMMNQDGAEEQKLLKSFACETGGFRAFQHVEQADMLSTAVALFALNFARSDMRIMKPACLDFIRQNFSDGAFLSGDDDPTADLEYTFYGLLGLGVLAN